MPRTIDRFTLTCALHTDGGVELWSAIETPRYGDGHAVALEVYRLAEDRRALEPALVQSAKSWRAMCANEKSLLRLRDSGLDPDVGVWVCMEPVVSTLASRIGDAPAPADQVRALVRTIAEALRWVHAQRRNHGQVRPERVFWMADGSWRLGPPDLRSELGDHTSSLSDAKYGSPENARDDESADGPAADIYALGILAYEFAVGRDNFIKAFGEERPGDSENSLTMRWVAWHSSLDSVLVSFESLVPGFPSDLAETILWLASKPIGGGPATAEKIFERLDAPDGAPSTVMQPETGAGLEPKSEYRPVEFGGGETAGPSTAEVPRGSEQGPLGCLRGPNRRRLVLLGAIALFGALLLGALMLKPPPNIEPTITGKTSYATFEERINVSVTVDELPENGRVELIMDDELGHIIPLTNSGDDEYTGFVHIPEIGTQLGTVHVAVGKKSFAQHKVTLTRREIENVRVPFRLYNTGGSEEGSFTLRFTSSATDDTTDAIVGPGGEGYVELAPGKYTIELASDRYALIGDPMFEVGPRSDGQRLERRIMPTKVKLLIKASPVTSVVELRRNEVGAAWMSVVLDADGLGEFIGEAGKYVVRGSADGFQPLQREYSVDLDVFEQQRFVMVLVPQIDHDPSPGGVPPVMRMANDTLLRLLNELLPRTVMCAIDPIEDEFEIQRVVLRGAVATEAELEMLSQVLFEYKPRISQFMVHVDIVEVAGVLERALSDIEGMTGARCRVQGRFITPSGRAPASAREEVKALYNDFFLDPHSILRDRVVCSDD